MMRKSITVILLVLMSTVFVVGQNLNQQRSKDNSVGKTKAGIPLNYTVSVSEGDSRCQILINDVPLMYYEGSGERSFFANSAILESGKQNIKIITSGKTPSVTIVETKNTPGEYAKREIWKNEGALEGNFTANVPYANIGWDNSMTISNDRAMINEANTWFEKMGSFLKSGKGSDFMSQLSPAEKIAALIYNLSKEETTTFHSNWMNFISKKEYSLIPLSDCKIEFAGNGKLIHLINNLGEGGLVLKANNGQMYFLDIFLHLPTKGGAMEPILANFKQVTTDFKKRVEN